jgi:hypothetical protein
MRIGITALEVIVEFVVPKDKLKEFLGLDDKNSEQFLSRFDAL